MNRMPAQSTFAVLCLVGNFMYFHASANAMMPTGTLIQKHQRQWAVSVKKPPSSGPATAEIPKTAPIGPMYLPRSEAGTMSAMIACDRIISPPPPRPCTPRHATSSQKPASVAGSVKKPAEPDPIEPSVKIAMAPKRDSGGRSGPRTCRTAAS